jgi:AraC family transcriptional regulator
VNEFFGTPLLEWRSDWVLATEQLYRPLQRIERHEHEEPYVCVVVRGAYRERSSEGERDCRTGAVLIHPAGVSHSDRFGNAESRLLMLAITPQWDRCAFTRPAMFDSGPARQIGARIHDEVASADDVTAVAIEGLLLELIALSHRAGRESRAPGWLLRARERIDDSLPRRCSIRDLSFEAGVHPSHFARVFRSHLGGSVADYVRERRVIVAKQSIAAGETLADAALAAGFSDQSELTRAFRRVTGTTPARFRRAL